MYTTQRHDIVTWPLSFCSFGKDSITDASGHSTGNLKLPNKTDDEHLLLQNNNSTPAQKRCLVLSGQKPVVGLRLYLEGRKCNQLAVHVQHLSSLPSMLEPETSYSLSQWQGSEDSGSDFIEPIQWKSYSRVCTAPVKHDPEWLQAVPDGVFVVTGAQLVTKGKWSKKVLHLRLLYTYLPNYTIQKTEWARAPAASHKGSFLTNLSTTFTQRDAPQKHEPAALLNSGVYPEGPPVPVQSQKLLRFVDMVEVVKGPHNVPGHWLVTAAKLVKEGGKIGLQVKFALLNYSPTG